MKAIVYRENGPPDVLRYEELDKPSPADDEVLLKVHTASVNPLDWRMMRGIPGLLGLLLSFRRTRLSRPGVDVAGTVESIGRNITGFRPGDEIFGACRGAFAEYACAPARTLAIKPAAITFEQAASLPVAALTALQGLRDHGHIQAGHQVLINGAAGGVGTFAVQLARHFGAEVTGVCSGRNLDLVRSLGAAHVIDYTQQDFTRSSARYDIILDNHGNHSLAACRHILTPRGRYLIIGGPRQVSRILSRALRATVLSWFVSQKLGMFVAKMKKEDLALLADLVASGKLVPVIDRRYPLSEVPAAIRYMEEEHARGKVIITVEAEASKAARS